MPKDKGFMHKANEPMLEYFDVAPQERYDILRAEVADIRDQWFAGILEYADFQAYCAKLEALAIMKMWSWNYYAEEHWIRDPEIEQWWKEAYDARL